MEKNSTTFNIDELITAYIDNQIYNSEVKAQIEKLINSDETVRKKYLCELLLKNYLREKLPMHDPPARLAFQIWEPSIESSSNFALHQTVQSAPGVRYPSFTQNLISSVKRKFFGLPVYGYAITLLLIFVFLLLFVVKQKQLNPYIISGTDKSIMVQAVNSFHKILKGEFKPQYTSSNAAEVEKYITENARFKPHIPQIEDYKLVGVLCNEYNGQKLAHLVYKNNEDDIFYIYQTPMKGIFTKQLELPEPVHKEIIEDKFYMCDQVDENDCTMTLWFKNDVICASLSKMSKDKMHATYTNCIK